MLELFLLEYSDLKPLQKMNRNFFFPFKKKTFLKMVKKIEAMSGQTVYLLEAYGIIVIMEQSPSEVPYISF